MTNQRLPCRAHCEPKHCIKPENQSNQTVRFIFTKTNRRAIESSPPPPPQGLAAARRLMFPPPSPPSKPSSPPRPAPPSPLFKQSSWSPDSYRDEAWLRQKDRRKRRSRNVTDEDLDELKACLELGFGLDSPEMDQRLFDTFPAYGLYYAVNKQYNDAVSKNSPPPSPVISSSECDTSSPLGSPRTVYGPGDNPHTVKTKLRQWAQVVACAVRQSPKSNSS